MSKRILSLVLALVMVLGTMGSLVFAEGTGNEKVDELIELGLVQGYGDGTYGLDKTITRAEVATMLVRALDAENEAKAMANIPSIFTDMSPLQWANGYVNYAVGKGIITGYPDKTFRPNNDITYAEVAKMLVEILDGLTDAEKASAVWPTTWLAKAVQLGVFDGVSIADYSAKAVREKVFEMVYNVYINKEIGGNEVIKAIVLENYRVEKLGKNEIVVEVIRELQASQYPEVSRKEQGDQLKLTIDAKVGDVEDMLGKVYDFTLNREGKVIKAQLDTSYEYKQGKVAGSQISRTKFAGYTVLVGERYNKDDERVFKAVLNNEAGSYTDMYEALDGAGIDFARYTVKNGKVLYIDAFNFDDIAPVAKVTDKGEVLYFDDYKDGEVDELDEADYVLVYEDGKLTRGEFDEIDVNDVLHWFVSNKKLTVVVRPEADNKVEGEYKEAYAAKAKDDADIVIVVDGKEYPALIKTERRVPVYSTTMGNEEFLALTEDYDWDLEPFEEEEVVLLRDMFGNVQLIGAEMPDKRFFAVISDLMNYDFELVKNDEDGLKGKGSDYKVSLRGTTFLKDSEPMSGTKEQQLAKFDVKDLVLVTADEDKVEVLDLLTKTAETVVAIDKDVIDFGGDDWYYISKNVAIFDVVGAPKATTIKEVNDNYFWKGAGPVKGYVVINDKDLAVAIVITDGETKGDDYGDEVIVKVNRVRMRSNRYYLTVETADGKETTHLVKGADAVKLVAAHNTDVKAGSLIGIKFLKGEKIEDEPAIQVLDVKHPGLETYKIVSLERTDARGEREIRLKDRNGDTETRWISRNAVVFGDPKVGDVVAIREMDRYNRLDIVYKVKEDVTGVFDESKAPEEPVKGVVTYINDTRIFIDGERYAMDEDTVLYDTDGKTILLVGGKEIASDAEKGLVPNDIVKVLEVKNGVIVEMKLVKRAEEVAKEKALEEALKAVTEGYKLEIDYDEDTNARIFTVSFEEALEGDAFPEAIEGFLVDVKITFDSNVPEGTKISINGFGGKEVTGNKWLLSGLLDIDPKPFVEGIKDDVWNVEITGNLKDIKGKVTFVTVISNDNFKTEYVIAEGSIEINVPVDEDALKEAIKAALEAVNDANSSVMMKKALQNELLELDIPADKLDDVATHVLEVRPENGYENLEALKADINEVLEVL